MKVKPIKSSLKLGKCTKLAPRYCGPFEILAKVGPVAHQLALPPTIEVHNVFHISILNKYVHDATHVINWNDVQVEQDGDFQGEPDRILERRETLLWNCTIGKVKL